MQPNPKCYVASTTNHSPLPTLTGIGSNSPTPSSPGAAGPGRRPSSKSAPPAVPQNHKVILVPADPTYSPLEEDLWPIINLTIHQALQPHPGVLAKVAAPVDRVIDEHRGCRNPFPAQLDMPSPAKSKK